MRKIVVPFGFEIGKTKFQETLYYFVLKLSLLTETFSTKVIFKILTFFIKLLFAHYSNSSDVVLKHFAKCGLNYGFCAVGQYQNKINSTVQTKAVSICVSVYLYRSPYFLFRYKSYKRNYRMFDWDFNCARVPYQIYLQKPDLVHVERRR